MRKTTIKKIAITSETQEINNKMETNIVNPSNFMQISKIVKNDPTNKRKWHENIPRWYP
jgi:hypothetical protein